MPTLNFAVFFFTFAFLLFILIMAPRFALLAAGYPLVSFLAPPASVSKHKRSLAAQEKDTASILGARSGYCLLLSLQTK